MCVVYWFSPLSLASGTQQFITVPNELLEILYADDTLILGQDAHSIRRYMENIAEEGKYFVDSIIRVIF